mmetsp:Transcript_26283/g.75894  ORF Transcript_26283/g.75894 Transcript_26283/m.75894 type:complete len:223 (-) Transcript_26283:2002-2670(-)
MSSIAKRIVSQCVRSIIASKVPTMIIYSISPMTRPGSHTRLPVVTFRCTLTKPPRARSLFTPRMIPKATSTTCSACSIVAIGQRTSKMPKTSFFKRTEKLRRKSLSTMVKTMSTFGFERGTANYPTSDNRWCLAVRPNISGNLYWTSLNIRRRPWLRASSSFQQSFSPKTITAKADKGHTLIRSCVIALYKCHACFVLEVKESSKQWRKIESWVPNRKTALK